MSLYDRFYRSGNDLNNISFLLSKYDEWLARNPLGVHAYGATDGENAFICIESVPEAIHALLFAENPPILNDAISQLSPKLKRIFELYAPNKIVRTENEYKEQLIMYYGNRLMNYENTRGIYQGITGSSEYTGLQPSVYEGCEESDESTVIIPVITIGLAAYLTNIVNLNMITNISIMISSILGSIGLAVLNRLRLKRRTAKLISEFKKELPDESELNRPLYTYTIGDKQIMVTHYIADKPKPSWLTLDWFAKRCDVRDPKAFYARHYMVRKGNLIMALPVDDNGDNDELADYIYEYHNRIYSQQYELEKPPRNSEEVQKLVTRYKRIRAQSTVNEEHQPDDHNKEQAIILDINNLVGKLSSELPASSDQREQLITMLESIRTRITMGTVTGINDAELNDYRESVDRLSHVMKDISMIHEDDSKTIHDMTNALDTANKMMRGQEATR
jgi:cell fate (sporulation/competence/biofilm development) regulator YlbF (YheA/YmcA/DUF963 family)